MAEFMEVNRQWKRMCNAYSDDCYSVEDDGSRKACPMIKSVMCSDDLCWRKDDVIRDAEAAIMAWAAEHPEPQYPTLVEWLRSLGLADHRMIDPIPAGIAEKLGIEPK